MEAEKGVELRPAHLRALLCLGEARHLSRFIEETMPPGYLWPAFDFRATPFLVYRGGLDAFLIQHPDPPEDFRLLTLPIPGFERLPVYYHRGSLPYVPAVGPIEVGGHLTATLPLSVFRAESCPEALVASVIHEAFHCYQAVAGWPRTDLAGLGSYPELSATNNALGNLEAVVLRDFLAARLEAALGTKGSDRETLPADTSRSAYLFGLVRRERRGPLDDEIVEYEKNLESTEGLARYVEVRSLAGASTAGYHPSKAFETLSGRASYSQARAILAEHVRKLGEVNLNAAGAAWWRFFHTGMALGLFADFLAAGWKESPWRGRSLDDVLEDKVVYDGGDEDERALEELKERYSYDERLDAEREFSRREKKRKEDLLATLLRGTGTRLTFDVSSLVAEETWWESGRLALDWDPGSVETITRNVRIHRKGCRFRGYGTELRFGDLPVVEDLKNRMFHVSVEAANLGVEGDGQAHPLGQPAEFEEGLEIVLPGVTARAKSGFVQNVQGTLYIKITR